jgi:tetratricopeptide (TPR) repeat protein/tRNA A-37 threonylcarbamoyl transferase component Bud32
VDNPESDKSPPQSEPPESPSPTGSDSVSENTTPLQGSPGNLQQDRAQGAPTESANRAQVGRGVVALAVGEVIAGRYRIIRFIGHGGMGEVYEAEDLELHERIALKTVRPEIASERRALDRFKREIQLARRVTHPNVSRIFDLGYHRVEGGGEVTFLTMELLPGESLAARLRTVGRMTASEAYPLVAQMASALTAAHEAGIVHRDFKPGNVMLVPTKGAEPGVRAVVTDFGLARKASPSESLATSLSTPGEVVGTPAYMAPEQVEGKDITSAADIYALGAVMYEMVTGSLPFAGETPFATALKRLTESPPTPRMHVPELDPKWEAAILRCLAREPAERFAKASEVTAALRAEAPVTLPEVLAQRRRRKRNALAVAGGVVALLLVAGVGHRIWVGQQLRRGTGTGEMAKLPVAIKPRRSVAVLGFKNLSGRRDQAWLSTALSEMLGTELAASERLRTIPGEEIARMKTELSLADADSFTKDTLTRIRAWLGPDLVVIGSYLALGKQAGGQIRLDLRLQDTTAGLTIASVAAVGSEEQLFPLVSKVGAELRGKLGVAEPTPAEMSSVQASSISNPEAARLYAQGLAKLRLFDARGARDLLEQAVDIDPQHPLLHAALAGAWTALGYDEKAIEEARKGFELSSKLPREERFVIEGRYRTTTKEWEKAADIYQRLFVLFPDSLDYGLRLAEAQIAAGRAKDALDTLKTLRELPAPLRDDVRIDLAEASAAGALSDFARQRDAALRAAQKGEKLGARLLVGRALTSEGLAYWTLGQAPKARASLEQARRIYQAAGDRRGVADTYIHLANLLADQGDLARATTMYEEAQAVYEEIGNRAGLSRALNDIALLFWQRGNLKGAKARFLKALAVSREIGDKQHTALVLDNCANVLWQQGDLPGARKMYEDALSLRREIGNLAGVATSLNNIGTLLHQQGDLSGAKKRYEESLGIATQVGDRSGTAYALFNLGEVAKMSGDLAEARQQYERALEIWNQLGEKTTAGETKASLGEVLLEQGRTPQALALAQQAVEEFQKGKSADSEAVARTVEARCLLAQQNTPEAKKTIELALGLTKKSENPGIRLYVDIFAARILASAGEVARARRMLEGSLKEARKEALLYHELEAKLALGEIELQHGKPSSGRADLEAVQKEASAKGFGLIARKAAAPLRPNPS